MGDVEIARGVDTVRVKSYKQEKKLHGSADYYHCHP